MKDLRSILDSHAAYLRGETEGERADFSGADLSGHDFSGRDLREADFTNADVRYTNFSGCRLCDADFSGANARGADFSGADLTNANTSEANMQGADFTGAKVDADNLNLGLSRRRSSSGLDDDATGFPMMWFYSMVHGTTGLPLMTSPGVFDPTLMSQLSKFNLVTPPLGGWLETGGYVASFIAQLRRLNPKIKILWYTPFQWRFPYSAANAMWTDEWNHISSPTPGEKRVFRNDGLHWPDDGANAWWWDPSKPGPGYATGSAMMIDTATRHAVGRGADGIFYDSIGSRFDLPGAVPPGTDGTVNFAALGYASVAAMMASVDAAVGVALAGLKGKIRLFCNRGLDPSGLSDAVVLANCDGELMEGFDRGWGLGTEPPGYYFTSYDQMMTYHLTRWVTPKGPTADTGVLIKCENAGSLGAGTPTSSAWNKETRYGLGTACLLGGMCQHGSGDGTYATDNNGWGMGYFPDELSVNRRTGQCTPGNLANMGWLGRPIEAPFKIGSWVWVRRFQYGMVAVNGNLNTAQSVDLGRPYRRLTGTIAPGSTLVNDGTVEQNPTINFKDGRFYVNA